MHKLAPMNSDRLKEAVIESIEKTVAKANTLWPGKGFRTPEIVFEDIGKSAGRANYTKYRVTINPAYLKDYTEDMVNNTAPHEVAHLITRIVYPNAKQHHGPEWKYVMRQLGVRPDPYHNYDITLSKKTRKRKVYLYECKCHVHKVTSTIHQKIRRGGTFSCKRCKTEITEKPLEVVEGK